MSYWLSPVRMAGRASRRSGVHSKRRAEVLLFIVSRPCFMARTHALLQQCMLPKRQCEGRLPETGLCGRALFALGGCAARASVPDSSALVRTVQLLLSYSVGVSNALKRLWAASHVRAQCGHRLNLVPMPSPPTVRAHAALTPTACLTVRATWTECVALPNKWLHSCGCGRSRGRHGPPGTDCRDRFRVGTRRKRPALRLRARAAGVSTAVSTSLAASRTLATDAGTAVGKGANTRHRTSCSDPRACRTARCGTDRCNTCTRSWAPVD